VFYGARRKGSVNLPLSKSNACRIATFDQLQLGDGIAVHFIRAVDDAHSALVRIGLGQPEVLADAGRAMRLIAQSTTLHDMLGATTLIMAISARASLLPTVSIL
jgi:hypothetical protein